MTDRATLRTEIEATRTAFHELLASLSAADWQHKTGNPAWNVRQLMYHVAWAAGYAVTTIDKIRRGKGSNIPMRIVDPVNMMITRWGARTATPASVAKLYDQSHASVLAALDRIAEADLPRGAKNFGEFQTVEHLFRTIALHFAEHSADIRKALGRI